MKKLILAILAIATLTTTSYAQSCNNNQKNNLKVTIRCSHEYGDQHGLPDDTIKEITKKCNELINAGVPRRAVEKMVKKEFAKCVYPKKITDIHIKKDYKSKVSVITRCNNAIIITCLSIVICLLIVNLILILCFDIYCCTWLTWAPLLVMGCLCWPRFFMIPSILIGIWIIVRTIMLIYMEIRNNRYPFGHPNDLDLILD